MPRISLKALRGASLNVDRIGSGPPIIAIHGFTGSTRTWGPLGRFAQSEYCTIAVDLLGHGTSDVPETEELYNGDAYIRAFEELLDKLDIPSVCWLGYSLGGRIALNAALSLPRRTWAVILESTSPGVKSDEERQDRLARDTILADWIEEVGIHEFVAYWESLPMWNSQARLPIVIRDQLRAQRLLSHPMGLAKTLRGLGIGRTLPLHSQLRDLRAPALVILGAEDIPYVNIGREIHQLIPRSRLEIIPNAGHAAHLEQPEQFNATIVDFLRQLSSES